MRLGNKATKAASRVAAEGVVGRGSPATASSPAIVEVNCETDFVAKNEDFLAFARKPGRAGGRQGTRPTWRRCRRWRLGDTTVEQTRTALVGRIGENLSIRRFERVQAKGRLTSYVHGGAKIGVLVDVVGGDETLARTWPCTSPPPSRWRCRREQVPARA